MSLPLDQRDRDRDTLLASIRVGSESLQQLPEDLYIPPEALRVVLEAFEGPLDLLLYLIRRQNLDILNIPIAEVTSQYMEYVELMRAFNLDLAAEYLVMAALLAEIKSRMLLPRREELEEEEDPRAELVRRLQEYERFKQAADEIDRLPRMERDLFPVEITPPQKGERPQPAVELAVLLEAFGEVLKRAELFSNHQISREPLSIRERMSRVLSRLEGLSEREEGESQFIPFSSLFDLHEGRAGVVISLMAILELIKEGLIAVVQSHPFAPIHIGVPTVPSVVEPL